MNMGFHHPYNLGYAKNSVGYRFLVVKSEVLDMKVGTIIGSPCGCIVTGITYANPGSRQTWYPSRTVCRIINPLVEVESSTL